MPDTQQDEVLSGPIDAGVLTQMTSGEIDRQVATAHAYPRSITRFLQQLREFVTMDEETAESMFYSLPRGGKNIEGPSARFAEVAAVSWRNLRAEARPVAEGERTVTVRGTAWDMEANVAIAFEVTRRITTSGKTDRRTGAYIPPKRYDDDMISVTNNAAGSIALRNAILKVIPRSLWWPIYVEARKTAVGDHKTLANRRAAALTTLAKYGATDRIVFEHLGVAGVDEVTLDHLGTLRGYVSSLKSGETTMEALFDLRPANGGDGVKRASETRQDAPSTSTGQEQAQGEDVAPASSGAGETGAPVHSVSGGGEMPTDAAKDDGPTEDASALPTVAESAPREIIKGATIEEVTPLADGIADVSAKYKKRGRDIDVLVVASGVDLVKLASSCAGSGTKMRLTTAVGVYMGESVTVLTDIAIDE